MFRKPWTISRNTALGRLRVRKAVELSHSYTLRVVYGVGYKSCTLKGYRLGQIQFT